VVGKSSTLTRKGNEEIRAVVKADPGDRIPFFCECGRESCRRPVWLSLDEFTTRRANGWAILAHETGRPRRPAPRVEVP
jgi:hypothetical protein